MAAGANGLTGVHALLSSADCLLVTGNEREDATAHFLNMVKPAKEKVPKSEPVSRWTGAKVRKFIKSESN